MSEETKKSFSKTHAGEDENTAEFLARKHKDEEKKAALHSYPVEDKRKDARREHTNGSTPKRDQ